MTNGTPDPDALPEGMSPADLPSPGSSGHVRPPRQSRTGLTNTGVRKAASKSARSRAREFAVQALYQHLVGGQSVESISAFTRDLSGFHKSDSLHFDALLTGCVAQAAELDALILPLLDRKMEEISPIERSCMWIGVYELQHCADVPWRVVLNECIELAKEFGGTDGHKYVNGVLNALAPQLRPAEVARDRAQAKAKEAKAARAGNPPGEAAGAEPPAT